MSAYPSSTPSYLRPTPFTHHDIGRLITDKRLRVLKDGTNQPLWDVWAIGDASVIDDPRGVMLPATAQVAAQKSRVRSSSVRASITIWF